MDRSISSRPRRLSSGRPSPKSTQGLDKRKGASEEPSKLSKQAREEARALAKTAEEALRNTSILERELKAAKAERTKEGRTTRKEAQHAEKGPLRKMDPASVSSQGSKMDSGIPHHENLRRQGNAMLGLHKSSPSTSAPVLPSNHLQHVRSTDIAPSSSSFASHALAPDTFVDSPQTLKTQEHSPPGAEVRGGPSPDALQAASCNTSNVLRRSCSGAGPENTPQEQLPVDRSPHAVDCRAAGSDPGQRNSSKLDAVPSLLRSESASPPLQPSRIGGHRFLSSLGELKAGTTLEQKLHAAAQRQTLLRDLEEQVRLKKAQKEAQRAEERAAEEREEAKLRDHYARKSLQSSMNYADMVGQNTESSPAFVSDYNAAMRYSVPNNSDVAIARLAEGQAQSRSVPVARDSASTSPTWHPLERESDGRRQCQVAIPASDRPLMRASITRSPDTIKLSAFCGPLAEMNRDMYPAHVPVLDARDPAADESAQDSNKRGLADRQQGQVQELLHELQLQQAALVEQFARHELALEELRIRSPPERERVQGDSPIPLAAATSHDTQDLPCTSNLVPLEVNQIPERLGEVPLYLSPLQEKASNCPAEDGEGSPVSPPVKQSPSSTDCRPGRKAVKEHTAAIAAPRRRAAPPLAVGQPVASAPRKQFESISRGPDNKPQGARPLRRAWAR